MIDASFWLAISSIRFVALAYRPIKSNLFSYLDKEISQIQKDISEASYLKSEAKNLVRSLAQKLAQYEESHKVIIARGVEQNNKHLSQNKKELNLFITKRQQEITLKIEQLKLDAIAQIKKELRQKATDLTIFYLKSHSDLQTSDTAIATRLLQE